MTDEDGRLRQQLFSKAFNPTGDGTPMPPPPAPPTLAGRDKYLLRMQKDVFNFYKKYNPDKLRKSVLAVALQIWWDSGLIVLNHFLTEKYGRGLSVTEDYLDEFDRQGEDVTMVSKHELNVQAGNKHLMVKAMVKTNSANYFMMNKMANTKMFEERKKQRQELGNKPVSTLFLTTKRASASHQGSQVISTGDVSAPRQGQSSGGKRRRRKKHSPE